MLCENSDYLVCFEDTLTQNCPLFYFTTTFKAEKQQKQPIAKPSPNHRRVRTSTFSFSCQFSENLLQKQYLHCRKSISTLSKWENVKEQLFQRTQAENTEGEKTWVKDNWCLRIRSLGTMLKVQIHVGWRSGGVGGWVGSKQRGKCASILRLEANLLIAKVF